MTKTKTEQRQEGSNEVARPGRDVEKKDVSRLCPSFSMKAVLYNITLLLLLLPLIIVVSHPLLVGLLSIILSSILLNKKDYGDGGANLRPAAMIFYSLALAQGVLYLIWLALLLLEQQMVKLVCRECKFESSWGHNYVSRYLTETRSKCLKDLSATRERNMITHASELMDSDYKDDYISGAKMLVTFIGNGELPEKALIRLSRNRIQKLILILAWRDQDDMEIRLLAAKIVQYIAGDISLAQFPGTLDCLSSLLKVSEEHPIFTSELLEEIMEETEKAPPIRSEMKGGTSMEKQEDKMEVVSNAADEQPVESSDKSWCRTLSRWDFFLPNFLKKKRREMEGGIAADRQPVEKKQGQGSDIAMKGKEHFSTDSSQTAKDNHLKISVTDAPNRQQGHVSDTTKEAKQQCQLIIQGLLIVEKLCRDEHNCIQICNARILIRHILAWVFARPFLKQDEKGIWVTILTLSFNVLARLASIRGKPATMVREEIVFELFPSCLSGYASHPKVQSIAIYTFSRAYSRKEFSDNNSREKRNRVVSILVGLFSLEKIEQVKSDESEEETIVEAGKALSRLSVFKQNCVAIIKSKENIVFKLSNMIDCCKIIVHKAVAAHILMRLISHWNGEKPDEVPLQGLGNQPEERLLKVLQQLFSIHEEENRGNNNAVPGPVQTDNLSHVCYDLKKLQAILVRVIFIMLSKKQITEDQFGQAVRQWQFRSNQDGTAMPPFLQFLKMLVDRNISVPKANPLEIIKLVAALIELMIERNIMAAREILDAGILDSLSSASDTMSNVDSSMLYIGTHYLGTVDATTLSSLVNRIREHQRAEQGNNQLLMVPNESEIEEFPDKKP